MANMEFLEEIPINVASALQQLLGRYQTVRDGLPELIKNSKDHYARLKITEIGERVIVVLISSDNRRIAVLDFGGALSSDFIHWRKWADPYANRGAAAQDIEGGFGTGGKGFMVRGSTEDSFFESCRDGHRTKMGYTASENDHLYFPAFFVEDEARVDNVAVKNARKQLELVLADFDFTYASLPAQAKAIFEKRQAFTMVQVNGVRDWVGRRATTVRQLASQLASELVNHAQAALTIETCSVYVVLDAALVSPTPLQRSYPEPMAGFEQIDLIPIPQKLEDPKTGDMIDTGAPEVATVAEGSARSSENAEVVRRRLAALERGLVSAKHYLELKTSRQPLRSGSNRAVNVVRVRNARNVIGNWSVADLCSNPSSSFIFGTLNVPTMGPEHQVGTDRVALADTPLVRALEWWTSNHVTELAARIQKAISKEHKPQEVDKANDGLRKMRDAMRQFLADAARGKGGLGPDQPPTKEEGTVVRQIVLESGAQSIATATGTSVSLNVKAYDHSAKGERLLVKGAQLDLLCDPPNLVAVHRRTITAIVAGRTTIWFRDPLTGIESNRVEVEIVDATGAEIQEVPSRLLLQGEQVNLRITFKTSRKSRNETINEVRADLVVDAEIDEPNMGRVDRYGVFTAGGREGTATVRVRYGSNASDAVVAVLQIGQDRVKKPPKNVGNDGADVPLILLCGVEAPNMEQYPEGLRTVARSDIYPTIIDFEPPFEPNVIFVNPDSKEAFQVRSGRGKRPAGLGSETFLQFLAIKCFEILKRLYMRQSVRDGAVTELEVRQLFGEAEITCAPFVEQAFEIARELAATAKDQE